MEGGDFADAGESTSRGLVEALRMAFINERCAPDLLPHQDELVNQIKELLLPRSAAAAVCCSASTVDGRLAGCATRSDRRASVGIPNHLTLTPQ